MVHPYDHVTLRRAGRADRQGTRIAVERDQRARGVEAHSGNRLGRQTRRLDRFPHGQGRRPPDVVGGLLHDLAGFAPDRDGPPGAGDEPPDRIENAGPRAEGADVHSDIGLAHGVPGVACGGRILPFRRRWQARKRQRQAGKLRTPAAPVSRPKSRRAPAASQLSALTGPPPASRAGISAASAKRHNRTTPSAYPMATTSAFG